MISWRFAGLAILVATAVAGGITYFAIMTPATPSRSRPAIADDRAQSDGSSRFDDIEACSATKYGGRHNRLPARRRRDLKASAECESIGR